MSVEAQNGSYSSTLLAGGAESYVHQTEPTNGDYTAQGVTQNLNDNDPYSSPMGQPIDDEHFAQFYTYERDYHSSAIRHFDEVAYPTAISIESGENGNSPGQTSHDQTTATLDSFTDNSPLHHQDAYQTLSNQHSPPLRRWSIENAPEERLRVGLPRWESEEHRVAYNDQNPKGDSNQRDQDIVDERSSTQQRRHARGSDHKKSRNRR